MVFLALVPSASAKLPLTTHGVDVAAPDPLTAHVSSSSPLPLHWCGQERSTDDLVDALPNGTHQYHAIYAIASDGQDRLSTQGSVIQYSMVAASALLESLYDRAIRFDMGTSCGQGYVDITALRLPQTTAELKAVAAQPNGTLDTVSADLRAAGFPTTSASDTAAAAAQRTTNWVVFLDAPGPAGCGEATEFQDPTRSPSNPNNFGGQVALLFKAFDDNFCGPDAVRHEIGHTLGALQSVAPHAFDGYHCNDSNEDTMCYTSTGALPGHTYFDYNNDDYWDPPNGTPLPWWTANLNDFLCPDATCNVPPGLDSAGYVLPQAAPSASVRGQPVRVRLHALRRGDVWRLRVTLRHGSGTAWVLARCDERPQDWLLNRPARLGATLRAAGRCQTRPRAAAFRLT